MTGGPPADPARAAAGSATGSAQRRFLTLQAVADELGTTFAQVYALVRRGDLPAIKLGGRGQWRIERTRLEDWIARQYAETAAWVEANPLVTTRTRPSEELAEDDAVGGGQDSGPEVLRDGGPVPPLAASIDADATPS